MRYLYLLRADCTRALVLTLCMYLAVTPAFAYSAAQPLGWFGGLSNVAKTGASAAADYLIKLGGAGTPVLKRVAASSAELGATAAKRIWVFGLGYIAVEALLQSLGWLLDRGAQVIYKEVDGQSDPAKCAALLQYHNLQGGSCSNWQVTATSISAYVMIGTQGRGRFSMPNTLPPPTRQVLSDSELGQILLDNDTAVPEMMTPTANDTPPSATRAYGAAASAVGAPATTDEPAIEKPANCTRNTAAPKDGIATATCSQLIEQPTTKPDQCGFGQVWNATTSKCDPVTNDPNAIPKPLDLPAACTWLKFFCDFFSDTATSEPNTTLDIPLPTPINAPPIVFGGSCPLPRNIPVVIGPVNTNIELSFQPFCDLASMIRPIVIAVAGYQAALIISGNRTREGE